MDFLDLAKSRYSERSFDQRTVEQEKLDKILEAGQVVPTACNYQPQKFYLIRSEEGLKKLRQVTPFHYNVPLMIPVMMLGLGYPAKNSKAHAWHYKNRPIDELVEER
jgi:nitroreductase